MAQKTLSILWPCPPLSLLTSYPSSCSLNQPPRPLCCSTNMPGTLLSYDLCCSCPLCWNAFSMDISSANAFTFFLKLSLLNEFCLDYSIVQSLQSHPEPLSFCSTLQLFPCIYDILTYHIIYLLCLLFLLCFILNTCYIPRRNRKKALLSIGLAWSMGPVTGIGTLLTNPSLRFCPQKPDTNLTRPHARCNEPMKMDAQLCLNLSFYSDINFYYI